MRKKIVRCENCKYFVTRRGGNENGACHRFPPSFSNAFPMMGKNSWCGEFKRAKKKYEE